MVPGQRRSPSDRAIAGVVSGAGAVQAGALELLCLPKLPLAPLLPGMATALDLRALSYAVRKAVPLFPPEPALVSLPFNHRTAFLDELCSPGSIDRDVWQLLALLTALAFDTAAHLETDAALAAHHPGLLWQQFPLPQPNGSWYYDRYSYARQLAPVHPATTESGSPA
ncbi:DUF5987 family protein [Streptomyces sp. NPDC016734]|uniref:DUF5987 family protein n=1 Tax=Streptomyces TaxID=1883 RepID=UPI0037AACD6B